MFIAFVVVFSMRPFPSSPSPSPSRPPTEFWFCEYWTPEWTGWSINKDDLTRFGFDPSLCDCDRVTESSPSGFYIEGDLICYCNTDFCPQCCDELGVLYRNSTSAPTPI